MPISITTGGKIMTGGNTIVGAGDVKPLSSRGVPVDNVDEVASVGGLVIGEDVIDGDDFTIGVTVYRFKDTPAQAFDVEIGADPEVNAKLNIVAAINLSGTPGVEYFAGTTIHPDVTATAFATDLAVLTAKVAGAAGNSIALAESFTDAGNIIENDAVFLGDAVTGLDDVDGAYLGKISAGGYVFDYTNENMYENIGTQAKPVYDKINA